MITPGSVKICVPYYKEKLSEIEQFSFDQMCRQFHVRDIVLIGPEKIQATLTSVCRKSGFNYSYRTFADSYFKNIRGYNTLLRSRYFYEKFATTDYLVICQLDVLILKDDIDYWTSMDYDNIGSPLFEDYTAWKTRQIRSMGANGGFCMRKVKSCIEALSKPGFIVSSPKTMWQMESTLPWKVFRFIRDGLILNYTISGFNPIINEDIFWSICVPEKYPWFKCCPPIVAAEFSFDANPRYLYESTNHKLPMAIHAWWRYDKKFALQLLKATS